MKYQTRQFSNSSSQTGFTIVELIITLAIAALLLTQAVPSFNTMIQGSKLSTDTNDLVADINNGRSEAISRGVPVIICRSDDPRLATAVCDGAGAWTTGWLLFADDNRDGAFTAASDTLIRIGQPASSTITIISNGFSQLQYNADGTTSSAGLSIFAVCDDRGEDFGRRIQVNTTGRPRLIKGTPTSPLASSSCTNPV